MGHCKINDWLARRSWCAFVLGLSFVALIFGDYTDVRAAWFSLPCIRKPADDATRKPTNRFSAKIRKWVNGAKTEVKHDDFERVIGSTDHASAVVDIPINSTKQPDLIDWSETASADKTAEPCQPRPAAIGRSQEMQTAGFDAAEAPESKSRKSLCPPATLNSSFGCDELTTANALDRRSKPRPSAVDDMSLKQASFTHDQLPRITPGPCSSAISHAENTRDFLRSTRINQPSGHAATEVKKPGTATIAVQTMAAPGVEPIITPMCKSPKEHLTTPVVTAAAELSKVSDTHSSVRAPWNCDNEPRRLKAQRVTDESLKQSFMRSPERCDVLHESLSTDSIPAQTERIRSPIVGRSSMIQWRPVKEVSTAPSN